VKGLFVPPKADASNLYRQIWNENKGDSKDIRMLMHPMWREFEAYSDKKFVGEIQKNFDGCFWEMKGRGSNQGRGSGLAFCL